MLDYILEKIVYALCYVLAMIDVCAWVVFTSTVNFAINATVDFFQLSCVQAVLTRIRNFASLAVRSFFSLRCVQDMCERILDFLRLIVAAVCSFNDQDSYEDFLMNRLHFSRRELVERTSVWSEKRVEAASLFREVAETRTRFNVAEVIRIRDLFQYAQLLYRTTRAELRCLHAAKRCDLAASRLSIAIDLARRVFPEYPSLNGLDYCLWMELGLFQ